MVVRKNILLKEYESGAIITKVNDVLITKDNSCDYQVYLSSRK